MDKIKIIYKKKKVYQPSKLKPNHKHYFDKVRAEAFTRQVVEVDNHNVIFGVEGPIILSEGKFWSISAEVENGRWGKHWIMIAPDLPTVLKRKSCFDILSYPLKEKELLWNLANTFDVTSRDYFLSVSLGEIIKKSQYLQEVIRNNNGFYFLKGREELIEERKEKERISEQNWKKLKKITPIINWTPFLKGVFVSGSLAINNSNKSSDIDLMIIAEKGRIFTVRFFLTLFLSIIRERRTPHKIAGKICLNHYLADNALRVNFPSVYNAYTYLHLKPIISREGVFERFRKEQDWMKDYILFWDKIFKPPFQIEKKSKTAVILEKKLSGSLGDTIEEKLKNIQLKRKEKNYPQGIKNGRVILNDYLIELHPDSPEKEILKRYQKKLKELLF